MFTQMFGKQAAQTHWFAFTLANQKIGPPQDVLS